MHFEKKKNNVGSIYEFLLVNLLLETEFLNLQVWEFKIKAHTGQLLLN